MDLDDVEELRAFVRDGKLIAIPRRHKLRMILLDRLAQAFEPGRHYTEAEVNEALRVVYSDYAMLRRALVDEGLLDREAGQYWRSGGSVG